MTDKHPKRSRDLRAPLWRLRHNTAQMACATSPLDVPLHPNLGVLAQRRGRLLRQAHTRRRLKRSVFRSLVDLQVAINRFLAETNSTPKPFVWTADPKRVLAAVKRGKEALESIHKQSRKSALKRSLRR
jgi:hypothetical protein